MPETDLLPPMTNPQITILAKQLRHSSAKKREAAVTHIRAMPPDKAVKTIIEILQEGPRLRDALTERMTITVFAVVFFAVFRWFMAPPGADLGTPLIVPLLVVFFVGLGYTFLGNSARTSNALLLEIAAKYRDVRLITPLLRTWKSTMPSDLPSVNRSLLQNLPLLASQNVADFPLAERTTLRNLILCPYPPLQIAVLETLLRIEDTEAIPTIERALREEANSIAVEVKTFAETCLTQLKALKTAEQQSKILLRPSHDTTGADTLLRVAPQETEDDAGEKRELLRPDERARPE